MWMRDQTAVNDMFEIKINELESFCSQREERPDESDHRCQDQTLQTKAACSFIHEQKKNKKNFKDTFFKEKNKTKRVTERKILELHCLLNKARTEQSQPICYLSGKRS